MKFAFCRLHRTNRRLAKTCVKRLMEKEQNRSLPQTFTTSPVLEPPGAENIHNSSGFRGNTTTRETLLFSTSRSRPSFDSIVTALMKVSYVILSCLHFRFLM